MVINCKMCGGDLDILEDSRLGTCQYCGTTQTIPNIDSDKKANLYDRANHFRRNNEFDKAMEIYETILNEDTTDAESYWSLVLCRYGIEYVEDPVTHKRVPTCNRTQYTSIFADEDYKQAIANADAAARVIYETEAQAIDDIQKGILEISQQEEPFDVFICYKETDEHGRRTPDSVLAQELYYELEEAGLKAFFSRITLEDKLGSAYEPYIFAALNSAKVMIVIGTKKDYLNAVWVKNEWSRYLALIKKGEDKVLVPAYKDMDPYDLPDEFSHLQAQDMSKLGFMQDLLRGIQKITGTVSKGDVSQTTARADYGGATAESILGRAFLCMEEREFAKADQLLEQALNINFKNAQAYIGKLMCDMQVTKKSELSNCDTPLMKNSNYKKALRFADQDDVTEIRKYNRIICDRIEQQLKQVSDEIEQIGWQAKEKQEEINKCVNQAMEVQKEIDHITYEEDQLDRQYQKEKKQLECECEQIYQAAVAERKQIDKTSLLQLFGADRKKQIELANRKLEQIHARNIQAMRQFEDAWEVRRKSVTEQLDRKNEERSALDVKAIKLKKQIQHPQKNLSMLYAQAEKIKELLRDGDEENV